MKKLIISSFLLLLFSSFTYTEDGNCSCKTNGHTYFAVRPEFQIGSPEYESLAHSLRSKRECGKGIGLQGVVFGGQSTNHKALGTYFAPYCSNEIPVDGTIA